MAKADLVETSMSTNPFAFGNPVRDPAHFYGREQEIRQIVGRLLSTAFESTSVVGERRSGKTSLLNYLSNPHIAERLGLNPSQYLMVYLDFQGCADITPARFWNRVLHKIARALGDEAIAAMAKEITERPKIDQYDLEDLFMEIETRNRRLVLLLDEFEYVTQNPNFGVDFFSGLRALAIHCPLALVTATRDELVDLCHSETIKSSPFFNIFASVFLRPFKPEEARALLTGELAGTPVQFSDAEQAYLIEIAGGHPLFVKMAGHYGFEARLAGLKGDVLCAFVAENVRQQAEPHFSYLWSHSSDSERITLLSILALKRDLKAPPTQDQLTKAYPRASYTLPNLIRRGLASEQDGRFDIFSALFGDWVMIEVRAVKGEEADEETVDKWLEKRGGIERSRWARFRHSLPKLKKQYWPMIGELLSSASGEVIGQLVVALMR